MAKRTKSAVVQKSLWKKIGARWQLYLLLLIPLVYIVVFAYAPMGGLIIAFKDYHPKDGIFGSEWVGFKNFIKFLTSYKFPVIMKNTLTLSL